MSTENKPPPYDREQVHDAEIYPLMDQVISICKREGIPMVCSFAYKLDDEGTAHFSTTSIGRGNWQPKEYRSAFQLIRQGFMSFAITSMKGNQCPT